jgi:hypothetical protein
MRIALSANGPGEVAGWVRPLLRALYRQAPDTAAYVFLVPDDYATGHEAKTVRGFFPQAVVFDPKSYVRFALGRDVPGVPDRVDLVQYAGGDLLHAGRLHARLKGRAATYKFSRKRYSKTFDRAFAVDAANVAQLEGWGTPPERIELVGNLAIDGALLEAQGDSEPGTPDDGILIMPGARPHEVAHLFPLFFTAALKVLQERPEIPIAFGLSPFTSPLQMRTAIERGGDPRVFAQRGRVVHAGDNWFLESLDGRHRIPVLFRALAAALRARLVLTIPGTKTIEMAALGKPAVAVTPYNAPELVAVNGPLTYLDRVPLVGVPLKRSVAMAVARRFEFHTQPNMDAGAMLIHELHGTVTPGRIARVALERYDDAPWLQDTGLRLGQLYRDQAGASDRMAASLLTLAG